ncbi:ferritin-like domain-containing protein [Stachybotrys elegans]|uniref:Ferritin-like domain-containing protein n=1 Tax=Stachybotrys elegans TaxID=80388 RepID=A0A8K0SRE6_9HYPO|nr:ferritin-like domain-containing protein [Stachybotrys elegans]
MPSFKIAAISALAAVASAIPSGTRFTERQLQYHQAAKRQNDAAAQAGLNDFDILQFALTLEHLEDTFYREGFARFPDSDFAALGLDARKIEDLKSIGLTESQHVALLQSALAQNGIAPVRPCTYNFGFTDAAGMVATAAILENVGVSAYLGAAPLLADPALLGVAGSILTIEARHQSSIRVFGGAIAVPQAFDAPLGPRAVFSLAAPFIQSCPEGSNLIVQAFPALTMAEGQISPAAVGTALRLTSASPGATHCAFTSGGAQPGGTKFAPFTEAEGCQVPHGVAGISYVTLTSSAPLDGKIVDDIIVAGPMAVTVS